MQEEFSFLSLNAGMTSQEVNSYCEKAKENLDMLKNQVKAMTTE